MEFYKNNKEAVPYFADAAEYGDIPEAWHNLGWLCECGAMSVAKPNIAAAALSFYKKAADLGYAQSMDAVGRMYAADQKVDEAIAWTRRAADLDYEPAKKRLKWLKTAKSGSIFDLFK